MSHDLSFNNSGNAELVLGSNTSAWHGLGTVFPSLVSREQAISIAMPWNAESFELLLPSKQVLAKTGVQITTNRTGRFAILRSDTAQTIGFVGEGYEILQPAQMFDFTEGVSVPGYETAGAIKNGSVLFLCAPIGQIDVLGSGDITRTYLTFINSFDGSIAAQVYLSGVRIVCRNTMQMSLESKQGTTLKFRHTKSLHDRLKQAQTIMESQAVTVEKLKTALETLATRKLKRQTYEDILTDLFPGEHTRTDNIKKKVTELFADNDNNYVPEFKNTAYALYNAVTNYTDHSRDTRITKSSTYEDTTLQRYENALVGTGMELKMRALERILVLSDGSEVLESSPFRSLPPKDVTPRYLSTQEPAQEPAVDMDATDYDDIPFNAMESVEDTDYTVEKEQEPAKEPAPLAYVDLYTTAPSKYDLPSTIEVQVVEKVSDDISVRLVHIVEENLTLQTEKYRAAKYFCADSKKWKEIQESKKK